MSGAGGDRSFSGARNVADRVDVRTDLLRAATGKRDGSCGPTANVISDIGGGKTGCMAVLNVSTEGRATQVADTFAQD